MAPISRPDSATSRQDALAWQTRTGAGRVALFASGLQRSDAPTDAMAAEAITATIRRLSLHGCLDRMAQEFGDHPDAAAARMRWICQLTAHMPAWPQKPAVLAARATEPATRLTRTAIMTARRRQTRHETDV